MKNQQENTGAEAALLRITSGVDTSETNSLCCAAAGIIAPSSAPNEALIPHEKLREATVPDATLNAHEGPSAQPVVGCRHIMNTANYSPDMNLGRRNRGVDLTNIYPYKSAVIRLMHAAELNGVLDAWLLLEVAQKQIAELQQAYTNLPYQAAELPPLSRRENAV
jgi:hypothetical protein